MIEETRKNFARTFLQKVILKVVFLFKSQLISFYDIIFFKENKIKHNHWEYNNRFKKSNLFSLLFFSFLLTLL